MNLSAQINRLEAEHDRERGCRIFRSGATV